MDICNFYIIFTSKTFLHYVETFDNRNIDISQVKRNKYPTLNLRINDQYAASNVAMLQRE